MKKFLECFLMLFLSKKALKIKQEAITERHDLINNLALVKKKNDKFLSKYSGRKRYVKV